MSIRPLRLLQLGLLALWLLSSSFAQGVERISGSVSMAPGQVRAFGTPDNGALLSILKQAELLPSASSPVSVVGVFGPVELDRNACILANEAQDFPDAIYLGPSSLLVISAEQAENPLGLVASERGYDNPRVHVLFDPSARLYVSNARIGQRYTLFAPYMFVSETWGPWWCKPVLECGITQAYGNLETMTPISLSGLSALEQQAYSRVTVCDPVTYRLGLGLYGGSSNSLQARFAWTF